MNDANQSRQLVSRSTRWLIENRWRLLLVAAVAVVIAWWPAQQLDFDRSVENMLRRDDPLLPAYRLLKRTFGGDEVVLVTYTDSQLMTPEGIERVAELTARIDAVPGVNAAQSLTTTPEGNGIITDEGRAPIFLEFFEGYHIGADKQTTAIAAILDPRQTSVAQMATVGSLRDIASKHDPPAVLVGGPVMVVEGFRLVDDDGQRLGWLSSVLLGLTIGVCFRSVRWVLAALLVVNATLVLTKALLMATGFQLTIVSSMLWTNVTVVGVATIMHVLVKFREIRDREVAPPAALGLVGVALLAPIMWTCLTDAAGFGSLLAAQVSPLRDFGFMMVFGSLMAMFSLATLLPGLLLWGHRDMDPRHAWGDARLGNALRQIIDGVLERPKTVGAIALILGLAAAWGCARLEVETDFTKNFLPTSDIVKAYDLVETRLGGAGVWDVILPAPPPEELNTRYLKRLRWLEYQLRQAVVVTDENGEAVPGLTKVMGLVDALDTVATPRFVARDVIVRLKFKKLREKMPLVAASLYGEDPDQPGQHYFRVMLRAKERQSSADKRQVIDQVSKLSLKVFPGTDGQPPAQVTGFFVLLANMIDSVVSDQWTTFGIAIVAIGAIMALAFRSPRLALIALVPNVFPVLIVTGLMGWLGYKINMGAAMIAAVSMGLSVDSEIHYITAFQRLRRAGKSLHEVLHEVEQSVGCAVVFSTLTLMVGFGALCASEFVPTIYFGVLVSLSIFGGLFGNLVVLPVLLYLFDTAPRETSVGSGV